jgi:hypothetical protein
MALANFSAGTGRPKRQEGTLRADWLKLLEKWDDTLSNALQLAPQKGVYARDLDAETERLYADHVAPGRTPARVDAPGKPEMIRSYCAQVCGKRAMGARAKKVAHRGVHLCGRSHAHRLRLPTKRHAGIRANFERFSRARRGEGVCVYGGAHPPKGEERRIQRSDRCALAHRERAAPVRA